MGAESIDSTPDQRKLQAEIALAEAQSAKALVEVAELHRERTRRIIKGISIAFGAVVAVITALVGVAQLEEARVLKNEDNFQAMVKMLGDQTPGVRLGAVVGLYRFVAVDNSASVGIGTLASRGLFGIKRPLYRQHVTDLLVTHLGFEPESSVLHAAANALVALGSEAVPRLRSRRNEIQSDLRSLVVGKSTRLRERRRSLQLGLLTVAATQASIEKAKMDLRCATLTGLEAAEADLSGADLSGSVLWKTDLFGARLRGTKIVNARMVETDLRRADFDGADLGGSNIRGTDFRNARNLQPSALRGTNWRHARLDAPLLKELEASDRGGGRTPTGRDPVEVCPPN